MLHSLVDSAKMKKGGNSCKKEFPPLHVLMIIKYINARRYAGRNVCVCLHKSHTYPNLQDTFLNTGIYTMQRTTECCLNRLPYFLKCAVNQNTLSFNY